ncbi:MAG: nuclear transport factor 2 family protein [Parvibaculum sp.]|nr:nuclear transport factor 2 family protein [Parvibaculum sp.]
MQLPLPIRTYFEADRGSDSAALAAVFAEDAVVKDEGETHRGRAAIEAWWRAAKVKYRHMAEPLELREEEGGPKVRARVTGDFPGSPVLLTFSFRLAGGKIGALEIGI